MAQRGVFRENTPGQGSQAGPGRVVIVVNFAENSVKIEVNEDA
jgi:hypothetical protein